MLFERKKTKLFMVLLVEDSPLAQFAAKKLLEQAGATVEAVSTGEEAVALCRKKRYDVILLDVGLPGIDGFMAASLIREQELAKERTPIIALTVHNDPLLKAEASRVGMDDYFVKPLSGAQVKALLEKYSTALPQNAPCFSHSLL